MSERVADIELLHKCVRCLVKVSTWVFILMNNGV